MFMHDYFTNVLRRSGTTGNFFRLELQTPTAGVLDTAVRGLSGETLQTVELRFLGTSGFDNTPYITSKA